MQSQVHTQTSHKNMKKENMPYKSNSCREKCLEKALSDRKKSSQNTMELILCWSSTVEHGACPQVWFVSPVRLYWRKTE